jgi:hypothetical protein
MSNETFNCRTCDSLVESPQDSVLVVCASCGERYPSRDIANIPVSLIPSQSSEMIVDSVKQELSESRHMKGEAITIESVEGVYVPIFLTKTTIQGMWVGYHTTPHYTTGGGEQGPDAHKVWDSGSIDETTDYPFIASTSGTKFGMELIDRTLFDQQPVDLADVDWNAVENPILPIDIDASQLNQLLREQIIQDGQNRVLKETKTKMVTKFEVEVDYHDRCIVYVPFWTVKYLHKQRVYRAAVSGGDGKVLAVMEPVLFTSKLRLWVQSIASLAGAGFIAETSFPVVMERWEWNALYAAPSNTNEGEYILFIHICLVVFCWYMSLSAAKNMVADTRIKRAGETEDVVVFSQSRATLFRPLMSMAAITVVLALGFRIFGTIGILPPLLVLCMGGTTIRSLALSASRRQASEEEYLNTPNPVLMTYGQLAIENRYQLSK